MDGPPPQEEDFSSLSVADRLAHKNWKARVSAYETLIKTFQTTASDSDPAFKPYLSNPDILKKIVTDANAVAQEHGVECVLNLVKFAGENAARTREIVVPALVDKCFGSSRAGTKNHAIELVLQYVEVENGGAGVVDDILPGLAAKQPKTVAGCVTALKEIVHVFGITVTPPAPILKALPKIFGHTDKNVRAEGNNLTHCLYQYMGAGIETFLGDLKPVQVKELKEAFENMEKEGKGRGSVKPDRLTRAGARDAEANGGAVDEDAGDAPEDEAPPDPRMFAEEVDVVSKLPDNLQADLKSSKWKDRKAVLDELLTILNASARIQDAPELAELTKSLATCIHKDANINCVMTAANCMEALAKGVMAPFARFREAIMTPMMERLKERNAKVSEAIGAALDAVFATTTLADVLPDILPLLGNKNPQVKEGATRFLTRCLATSSNPIPPAQLKPVSEALAALLEDSVEGARNEAANSLGTLMKMVGERPLNALMDGLADVRKAKVKESYEKATVKCKAGGAAPKPPAPKAAVAPSKKTSAPKSTPPTEAAEAPVDEPPKPVKKPPARLMTKKAPAAGGEEGSSTPAASAAPPVKKVVPVAAAKPAKASAAPGAAALDTFKFKHTPEDAEALAADLIPEGFDAGLGDANWKTRLATLDEMTGWVDGAVEQLDAEVVVRYLAKKGWHEKNFQVSAKLYGILSILAERCPSFGRSSVALCVPHLSEKLGDMKLKKPAGETLLLFAEKTSLQFVLGHAYEPLAKQKAPKVLADSLTWIDQALVEFGIAGLSLRGLIEFLKTALSNSNAAVRTSATKTMVTVKLFAGSSIKDLLEDLNPQLMKTIFAEFDKVEGNPAPEPVRTSADVASAATVSGTGGKAASGGGDPLDDLFPRVEIDGLLKGTTILADAKSDAWKTKKEALETLQAILDQGANKRLKPTMGEIGQVLKARITDTNKAVQSLALDIVARIATGMGKPFEKQCRFFVQPLCTVLADQKAPIRASALQTLTAIATACENLEPMVPGISTALETPNPLQRSSLLTWLVEHLKDAPTMPGLELTSWAGPIVSCLDDRNGDVRKGAQAMLPILIAYAGFDHVMQQANSLKPASRSSAVPLIQAARGSAPAGAVPAAHPSKPAGSAKNASKPTTKAAPPPPEEDIQPPPSSAPASKLGVRRKLPQGSIPRPESRAETPVEQQPPSRLQGKFGMRRPSAVATPKAPSPAPTANAPFVTVGTDAKRIRLSKDGQKWINEGGATRKDLAELLQHQMEPHASKDLVASLFSRDHNAVNDHVAGLDMIREFYSSAEAGDERFGALDDVRAVCIANSDLALKYVSIKVHEPQSNLVQKCLEVVEAVVAFLQTVDYQLSDPEAYCFIPTVIHKLGDAREPVRVRVQQIVQSLSKVYAYSQVFHLLLEHGLKSKVAKTRQGTLDELGGLLKRFGIGACEPAKAFPQVATCISDKDPNVRKSALATLSEGYVLVGEKIWQLVGRLSPKDKTQLEERLRRVPGPSNVERGEAPAPNPVVTRLATGIPRAGSPAPGSSSRLGGIPRSQSPAIGAVSRVARPTSPAARAVSPTPVPGSPVRNGKAGGSHLPSPMSPSGIGRPKSLLPSRLTAPRSKVPAARPEPSAPHGYEEPREEDVFTGSSANGFDRTRNPDRHMEPLAEERVPSDSGSEITVAISSILSNDAARSVDALKKIQKVLEIAPDAGPSSSAYRQLSEHTEGLIETITLQMAHVFERPEDITQHENFRLAKHLIQTLNAFCDHVFLAESLTIDILTSLLEELTLRLLQTDNSADSRVKDLSRFINMIILRIFATCRRMSVFRALFSLLLQIVKPFPANGTMPDSQEAKVAELVLKCIWKLARNIPQDLEKHSLDPVELFPAIEHFLQSVPPNEWRARATNKVPCGDMPLRTIKVIIQHVVAHHGDDVYDLLSGSFDDPSATIVYPYVYRILNSSTKTAADMPLRSNGVDHDRSPVVSRPLSPQGTSSSRHSSDHGRRDSYSSSANAYGHGVASPTQEPDLDEQLATIIKHISSETTGAMHKEGITELHHFLKANPHKKPKVDKMLESTGTAFRKYITRALASRAAEDDERNAAVASTLSKLESNSREHILGATSYTSRESHVDSSRVATPTSPTSPARSSFADLPPPQQEKLTRLHDLFQYRGGAGSSSRSDTG